MLFILLVIGLTNHEIKYSNEVEKLKTEQNCYFFKSDVDVFLSMNKIITDGIDAYMAMDLNKQTFDEFLIIQEQFKDCLLKI